MKQSPDSRADWENGFSPAMRVTAMAPLALETCIRTTIKCEKLRTRLLKSLSSLSSFPHLVQFGPLPVRSISCDVISAPWWQIWFRTQYLRTKWLEINTRIGSSAPGLPELTSNIFSLSNPSSQTQTLARPLRSLSRIPFASCVALNFSKRLLPEPNHW